MSSIKLPTGLCPCTAAAAWRPGLAAREGPPPSPPAWTPVSQADAAGRQETDCRRKATHCAVFLAGGAWWGALFRMCRLFTLVRCEQEIGPNRLLFLSAAGGQCGLSPLSRASMFDPAVPGSPRTPRGLGNTSFDTMTEEELSESLVYLTCPICEQVCRTEASPRMMRMRAKPCMPCFHELTAERTHRRGPPARRSSPKTRCSPRATTPFAASASMSDSIPATGRAPSAAGRSPGTSCSPT